MLSLKNITKQYSSGDSKVQALDGISIDFRNHEFVSILGPSGCGKTTLLNIIGGLDQYTDGDLIINNVSTKEFRDKDWDNYRNHSIGFVFQSYNLIPHQTVLANVELALTLSGVSKRERRRRAKEALETVGLGDQLRKKPNQMSRGQMQRVAIARALVNDPEILLADEPTGALDTKTSVQIMDILHRISENKLIIMVTHNPELAKEYSSRIIELVDGQVKSDSLPYTPDPTVKEDTQEAKNAGRSRRLAVGNFFKNIFKGRKDGDQKQKKKRSMSFFTALSLSLNNLMTKKGRTLMTAFAGSIGIIGIALILSVSTGVNAYIESVQRETLSGYPIQLEAESVDLASLVTTLMDSQNDEGVEHELDKVYESVVLAQLVNSLASVDSTTNDLTSFKKYLESTDKFDEYLTAIQYAYNFNWSVFVREGNEISDTQGDVVKSDVMGWLSEMGTTDSSENSSSGGMNSMMGGYNIWEEMLTPLDKNSDSLVNDVLKEQYEIIDEGGRWPTAPNEVVLVVDENNEISDLALFALGLRTKAEMNAGLMAAMKGEAVDLSNRKSWDYETIRKMEFRLILAAECYEKQLDGTYLDLSQTSEGREKLYSNEDIGFTLKVVGIIRPRAGVSSTSLSGSIGYTAALAEEALKRTAESDLLQLQKDNPEIDVLLGLPFKTDEEITAEKKLETVQNYIATLDEASARAFLLKVLATAPTEEQVAAQYAILSGMNDIILKSIIETALEKSGQTGVTADMILASEELKPMMLGMLAQSMAQEQLNQETYGSMTIDEMVALLTEEQIAELYEDDAIPHEYSNSNYSKNLSLLGEVNQDKPRTIYLYSSTFEDKDKIGELIREYNDSVGEDQKISYTDYVKLLMSSITTVLNAITYVLIAFVAISLVVSSIMIGIITYISVLERTKEIGILRAIGASKRDVGRVFNAETLIVGFVAGIIGIGSTLLLNQIVNRILFHFTEIPNLKAILPVGGAVILVLISMFLTFIAGLLPSGFAAKKNPVEALRSE